MDKSSNSSESSDSDDEMVYDDSGNDTFHEPEAKRRKVGRPKSQYFDCKSRNAQKEKIKPALEACKTISKEQDIPMVSLLGAFLELGTCFFEKLVEKRNSIIHVRQPFHIVISNVRKTTSVYVRLAFQAAKHHLRSPISCVKLVQLFVCYVVP